MKKFYEKSRGKIWGVLFVFVISFSACASTPKGKSEPQWVRDPYLVYNKAVYIAAVGYGSARDTAEKSALSNLTSIFGQSITSESKSDYSYSQALAASSSVWSEKSTLAQAVKTSVSMDTLIGAEIKDVWKSDETWYAVAVMDKAKTNMIYTEMIQQNQSTISKLIDLTNAEKQSIDGFINYYHAASLADANMVFANVKNVISPGSLAGENLKTGDTYRLEATGIAKNIPIAVTIDNDRQNRIKGAFSGALSSAGFRTGGNDSRYVLKGSFVMEEVSYPNNPGKFIRYIVDANLLDTSGGTVIFPYTVNDREGHALISEAENRAVRSAETAIRNDYVSALSDFLTQGKK